MGNTSTVTGKVRPKIAFIGLGHMGSALARRIHHEHHLAVHDTTLGPMAPFAAKGAEMLTSISDLPEDCTTVFTCLPTTEMVEALVFQPNGLAATLKPGAVIVDMSTGHPDVARRIAQRLSDLSIFFADAPVSGGPQAADAGTITIMVGAATSHFDLIHPLLNSISPNVVHMGPVGTGSAMKLANNMLAAGNRLIAFEAVAIAVSQGIDARQCIDILNRSSGRNYSTEVNFPRHIFTDQLEQHFKLGLSLKDVSLAVRLLPPALENFAVSSTLVAVLGKLAAQIGGDQDINRIIRLYEQAAGTRIAHRTVDE